MLRRHALGDVHIRDADAHVSHLVRYVQICRAAALRLYARHRHVHAEAAAAVHKAAAVDVPADGGDKTDVHAE